MNKREQEIEMLKKLTIILKEMPTSKSIRDISEKTGISTSTIQKYLNKKEYIIKFLETTESSKTYGELSDEIKEWLQTAKKEGPYKGINTLKEQGGYYSGGSTNRHSEIKRNR